MSPGTGHQPRWAQAVAAHPHSTEHARSLPWPSTTEPQSTRGLWSNVRNKGNASNDLCQ